MTHLSKLALKRVNINYDILALVLSHVHRKDLVIYIYPFLALVLTDVSINDNKVMEISVSAHVTKLAQRYGSLNLPFSSASFDRCVKIRS